MNVLLKGATGVVSAVGTARRVLSGDGANGACPGPQAALAACFMNFQLRLQPAAGQCRARCTGGPAPSPPPTGPCMPSARVRPMVPYK